MGQRDVHSFLHLIDCHEEPAFIDGTADDILYLHEESLIIGPQGFI